MQDTRDKIFPWRNGFQISFSEEAYWIPPKSWEIFKKVFRESWLLHSFLLGSQLEPGFNLIEFKIRKSSIYMELMTSEPIYVIIVEGNMTFHNLNKIIWVTVVIWIPIIFILWISIKVSMVNYELHNIY